MSHTKEELAAQLVWTYVEYLRAGEGAEPSRPLTRDELDQLFSLFQTAGELPRGLGQPGADPVPSEVRERVQQLLSTAPTAPKAAPTRGRAAATVRGFFGRGPLPAWSFGAALSLILALGAALATVDVWRPAAPPRVVRVYTERPADVQRIDEQSAHQLIPRMVRNELTAREEKSLMWHMLQCPGCFDRYVALKHPGSGVRQAWTDLYELARR